MATAVAFYLANFAAADSTGKLSNMNERSRVSFMRLAIILYNSNIAIKIAFGP